MLCYITIMDKTHAGINPVLKTDINHYKREGKSLFLFRAVTNRLSEVYPRNTLSIRIWFRLGFKVRVRISVRLKLE